jgi:hypothetical protein
MRFTYWQGTGTLWWHIVQTILSWYCRLPWKTTSPAVCWESSSGHNWFHSAETSQFPAVLLVQRQQVWPSTEWHHISLVNRHHLQWPRMGCGWRQTEWINTFSTSSSEMLHRRRTFYNPKLPKHRFLCEKDTYVVVGRWHLQVTEDSRESQWATQSIRL